MTKRAPQTGFAIKQSPETVFVLFVHHTSLSPFGSKHKGRPFILENQANFTKVMPQPNCKIDRMAFEAVDQFFSYGGKRLSVILTPLAEGEHPDPQTLLQALLGDRAKLRQSTGLKALDDSSQEFDFAAAPQLAFLLKSDTLLYTYQQAFKCLGSTKKTFFCFEYPLNWREIDLNTWLSQLSAPRGIAFLPGVAHATRGFSSVLPLYCAAMELHEQQHGKAEAIGLSELPQDIRTGQAESYAKLSSIVDSRINFIAKKSDGKCVFMHGHLHTQPTKTVQAQRTEDAILDDLKLVAEPLVLEAFSMQTVEYLRQDFESYLDKLVQMRVLLKGHSSSSHYDLRVSLGSQTSDPVVEVDLGLYLYSNKSLVSFHVEQGVS